MNGRFLSSQIDCFFVNAMFYDALNTHFFSNEITLPDFDDFFNNRYNRRIAFLPLLRKFIDNRPYGNAIHYDALV
ncbi:hypothetical protein Tasa_010_006 [Tanticharoenia sakaeratensis NBRC 103193]|uniref:Uncharacterized protein n=1 Tax=Tanticharoenia sakaeratensis NBRC 103193 TaxID=1231623 RepID=A0A0D6MIH7_9PROT|nr:hypothetical protein Tasa_010_006 [Tanticharoenia sakaeratensis NBRC 103193]